MFINFVLMVIFSGLLFLILFIGGVGGSFIVFYGVFLVLFLMVGLGSGFIFQMIFVIFCKLMMDWVKVEGGLEERVMCEVVIDMVVVLGFIFVIGVIGGFFILKVFGLFLVLIGLLVGVMKVFFIFYIVCVVIIWVVYGCYFKNKK